MKIQKYLDFITEDIDKSNFSKYDDICDEVKSMIEKNIEKSGGDFKSFINSYLKNTEDVKVEGFINDSDIYDFYLKWRNDIDEILNELKFFNQIPTENNAYGLYEYVIKGSEVAFIEVVKMLK